MPATYEDAGLMMQIVRWGTDMGLEESMSLLMSGDFDAETASATDVLVGRVLGFGELIGTFVKQGILNKELVLDMWWVEGLWAKVGPAAIRERNKIGEARLYENFEALATGD
jgi:hypothetical protein